MKQFRPHVTLAAILLTLFMAAGSLYATGPRRKTSTLITSPQALAYADAMASNSWLTPLTAEEWESNGKEYPDDPAYSLYKEGYNLILDEEWTSARKKFASLLDKYSKSEYVDDAAYWSAYAMKNIDRKKAIAEYKSFIAKYPNSSYFDDAVADLSQLTGRNHGVRSTSGSATTWSSSSTRSSSSAPAVAGTPGHTYYISDDDSNGYVVGSGENMTIVSGKLDKGKGFAYSYAPDMGAAMRHLKRDLKRIPRTVTMPMLPRNLITPRAMTLPGMYAGAGGLFAEDDSIDEKTRLKMDALSALGDTREDSISFKTLRDVALDKKQPRRLRITALDVLSNFRKFDVLQLFIQVAREDTDSEIQSSAIDVISNLSKEKNRSVDALIDLFKTLPKSRTEQRETIFYTIAEIGNDRAVDFLSMVAKSSDDYELRSQAIYYLGNIGGDKARTALYEILKEN